MIIEDAISGLASVTTASANQALTAQNGAVDQARCAAVSLDTSTGANFAVYVPPVTKLYVIIKTDKIKKQKLVGIPFEITIDFNRKKNRYMGKDGFDYFANAKPQSAPEPRVEKFHRSGIEDFEINQETKTPF